MSRFHSLTVADIRRETPDCVSVALDVPETLADEFLFIQGQYLTFKKEIDGEEVRRSYSICTSPADGELRIAVKKVPGGRFSTYANEKLEVGDTLEVMKPMGRFYTQLDAENQNHYVAFAAGSGITPVMSILKSVLQTEPQSNFTLFFGNRNNESIIFHEQLEALKNLYMDRLRVFHVLSRQMTDSPLFAGRIDAEKAAKYCHRLFDPEEIDAYFLCGPAVMIESVKEALKEEGVEKNKIHFELFAAPDEQKKASAKNWKPEKEVQAVIEIIVDGANFKLDLDSKSENILDAALKTGADLPFACKGGVCCTCKAKVLEGEVAMEVNYALEPEEVEAGFVLTCQSHPLTESVKLTYDV
ncbi:MAG: phenylacetate-CoA oxygenase/reductase subunit PaaK [Bacteroidetes bacterium]|nr:phenylacetate-CoA oxygenase/reductase subunit PaaK [Bacteroidota bacterium]